MKIVGITYTDHNMMQSAELCRLSMMKNSVDDAAIFMPRHISRYFIDANSDIFKDGARGAGCYWLFKPFLLHDAMRYAQNGDVIIYSDAGVEFINDVQHIISRMDEDIFFFTNGFPHVEWCKMDVIERILPTAYEHTYGFLTTEKSRKEFYDKKQVQASVIFLKVNQTTRNFVKEWLLYCQMPGFIDDSPSKLPNYPTFAEHRHDQAILTCLQIKYGYKLHWWPTAYAEHIRIQGDDYPVMFNHHRKRDNEW